MNSNRNSIGDDRWINVSNHSYGKDIDFDFLDVVHWAPAMLTSAERLQLYTLVYSLRPKRCLEIGTQFGGSALIISSALKASNNNGFFISVDMCPEVTPEVRTKIETNSVLLTGRSPEILGEAAEQAGGKFDFVFIDGDHSRKGVLRDANGVCKYLNKGATMIFHDSYNPVVRSGIDLFSQSKNLEVTDLGSITREYTLNNKNGQNYCGFRLMIYNKNKKSMLMENFRRQIGRLRYNLLSMRWFAGNVKRSWLKSYTDTDPSTQTQ